jgi:Fic family protein
MVAALALADRLDEDAILAMHAALLSDVQRRSPADGAANRCGSAASRSGRTEPRSFRPHHDDVPALLAALARFTLRKDLPLLS